MSHKIITLVAALTALLLYATGSYIWTAVGLGATLFFFLRFIDALGNRMPIVELMAMMCSLQWILGPVIEYQKESMHYRYQMYVEEPLYMGFVVPAILAFWVGAQRFRQHDSLDELKERVKTLLSFVPNFPYYLIVIGTLAPYAAGFVPSSLSFAFFLFENVKYIGALYILQSEKQNRWLVFYGVMLFLVVTSIASGYFHNLLLWGVLLSTFLVKEWKLSFGAKISMAIFAILLAISVQSIKQQYRQTAWSGYGGNKTLLFLSLTLEEWLSGRIFMPSTDSDINVRLNQGWIISAVLQHVPEIEPYAKGETVEEALVAALLPRFLAPNKKVAGGQENFRRFTGLPIADTTSMGISMAGEGYANFGRYGGILFMLFWGLFVGWFWRIMSRWSHYYPTLLIWSPILFLQVVKAETEFAVVLNFLLKASILLFLALWFIKHQFKIRV
ncbi:MAG: hypothetical protein AB7C90_08600 [Bacteroidales bacterium]